MLLACTLSRLALISRLARRWLMRQRECGCAAWPWNCTGREEECLPYRYSSNLFSGYKNTTLRFRTWLCE